MTVDNGNQDAGNLVGKTLGQYEIISILGQGGMATVYKAFQPSLERHIALKVLLPHFAEPEFVARFKREALAAARLSHPNVVHIYDAGEVDGRNYIAMEYIDGGTLKDRLDERNHEPLDAPTIAQVVEGIGGALAFAHRNGVVHRDVKPANIMFTRGGRVVLADLGLAKFFEAADLTQMTAVIGTPFYMSPEQARSQAVDMRSDIYSLGVVFYEMLTGHVPFEADTPWMAIHQHIYEAPPPIRQMNPVVSDAVARVVEKALAKPPGDRYQRIEDMVEVFLGAQKRPIGAANSLTDQVKLRTGDASSERRSVIARSPVWLLVGSALVVVTLLSAFIFWGINQISGSGPASAARTFTSTIPPALSIATATSAVPTATEVPPLATATNSPAAPTATETALPPTPTDTVLIPTATRSPTRIPPTATATIEASATPTVTLTPSVTRTATPTTLPPTPTGTTPLATETLATETPIPPTETPAPPTSTLAPTSTSMPPTNTQAPPTNTQAPPTNTQAPPTNTQAPPTNTQAPPTNTQAPPTNTQAPPTNTQALPTNTQAPPTNTQAPPSDTPIPPTPTPRR